MASNSIRKALDQSKRKHRFRTRTGRQSIDNCLPGLPERWYVCILQKEHENWSKGM